MNTFLFILGCVLCEVGTGYLNTI